VPVGAAAAIQDTVGESEEQIGRPTAPSQRMHFDVWIRNSFSTLSEITVGWSATRKLSRNGDVGNMGPQ